MQLAVLSAQQRRKLLPRLGLASVRALAAALVLIVLATGSASAAGTLRVATSADYPPFNYFDEEGRLAGFDIEIARALCAEMEVQCLFIHREWALLIPALLAGEFDAIAASMSITEKRRRIVSFTDHYYRNASQFVTSRGSDFDPKWPEGKTIGALRATIASDWLEENVAGIATVRLYRGQTELLQALVNGHVDAVFGDILGLHAWLSTSEDAKFRFIGEGIRLDEGIGIAVRHQDEALRLRLNGALRALITNGIYRRINARYFPFSIH